MKAELRALTGLRGVAAVLVAIYHTDRTTFPMLNGLVGHFYLWVDLFFVLSGFVMALSYGAMFAEMPLGRAMKRFLVARIARIYPLYAVVTVATALALWLGVVEDHHFSRLGPVLAVNLGMVQAWGVTFSIVGPAWSISTEWGAYLLFPGLLVLAMGRLRGVVVTVLAGGVLSAISNPVPVVLPLMGPLDVSYPGDLRPVLRCLAEFVVGLVAYRAWGVACVRGVLGHPVVGPGIAVGVVGLMGFGMDLVVVGLFPLLVIALAEGGGWLGRGLASAVMHRLGVLSYAIYLLHVGLIPLRTLLAGYGETVFGIVAPLPSGVVFYGVLVVMAEGLHRFVEQPGRRLIRGFSAVS